jgi:hypothetical protein
MTREEYEYQRALAKARYNEMMYQKRASGYPKNYDLGGDGGPRRSSKGLIPLKNKGVMSNLGSIGEFVSDDNNDLDNLSFSTTDGLNATFKNNRVKDSVPKYKVGNENMQPVFPNFEGVTSDDLADPDKVIDFKPNLTALTSFIEENSAGPKGEYAGDKGIDLGYAGDKGIDLGYAGDSGISLDDNINLNQQNINQEEIPLDQLISEYDGALLEDQITGDGRFDGVTSDDLATTLSSQDPLLKEQFEQPLDGSNELEIGNEIFELPENYEALDQVVTEFELANPELVEQHRNEFEAEKLAEEKEYIENFALENPELAEHLLENPELVDELEDGEALYDGLVKLNNENLPAGQFEGVTSDDLALEQGLDQGLEQEVLKEEKDNREAYIQLSNSMSSEDLAALENEVNDINSQTNVDGQEVTESKLADLFGSLKDIFGVDNKSLLRALVKYIGGRVFGMSSGKAAQFAWAGIEADMATEAAKGADARAYQENMDEYDKMYEAAMDRGDFDEANRILQKMNSLSGVEKSDAEKFDDNLAYLNKKYDEAKKANDTRKMSQIDKQLKAMEAAGIDGTKADTWMGSAGMYDKNGTYVVKQAMQVDGQGLKVYDEASGTFKLPSELGYRDAIRTTTSDTGTEKYAVDERIITDPEDYNAFSTEIPNAISVSPKGVPKFDEGTNEANKMASFSHTSVKSIMMMEDMLAHSDEVRQEIFSLQAEFRKSIADQASDSPMKGVLAKFIKRGMSPAAKLWFNEMNTLVTSKLRRETGAAYNKEELITTMNFFPNASDYPKDFSGLDREGKTEALKYLNLRMSQTSNWILTNAQGLEAHEYLEGLHSGLFRPDDNWLKLNREMIEYLDSRYKPTVSTSTQALIEQ